MVRRLSANTVLLRIALLGALLLGAIEILPADDILVAEVWMDRSPVLPAGSRDQADGDEIAESLLAEAQYVFSGMIYGFTFVYTPSDRARSVEQVFRLEPLAVIPWGDDRLSVSDTRGEGYRTYGRFRYRLSDDQAARVAAWASSAVPAHGGEGSSSITGGRDAKYAAIEDACRETIRDYLRTKVYNKPREIRGQVTFAEPPRVRLTAGGYTARVRLKIRVEVLRVYRSF